VQATDDGSSALASAPPRNVANDSSKSNPLGDETSSACCTNGSRTVHTPAADSKIAEATQLLLGADKKFPQELAGYEQVQLLTDIDVGGERVRTTESTLKRTHFLEDLIRNNTSQEGKSRHPMESMKTLPVTTRSSIGDLAGVHVTVLFRDVDMRQVKTIGQAILRIRLQTKAAAIVTCVTKLLQRTTSLAWKLIGFVKLNLLRE